MNMDNYKVIFLGGSEYVIPLVDTLNKYFHLEKVIVKNENDPLAKYCKENNISYISANTSDEVENIIKEINPVVGIIADFGLILTQNILNLFPKGVLNIHPSLLPKFRGPTPVQTAILNGQTQTGVTLFQLDEEIDHGPIISQEDFETPENFTSHDLLIALFKLGAKLIEDNLEDYINGDLLPTIQSETEATYTKTFSKQDGFIDLSIINTQSSIVSSLNLKIRAFFPWPGVWTEFDINGNGIKKIIKLLPNNEILVEGKKTMKYKDFINGYEKGEEFLEKLELN